MTDALPDGTRADAVRATIDVLQTGLALIPRAQAVNRIDDWHRILSASDRAELQQIAEGLTTLKSQLLGPNLDADAIGATLARLGEQTAAAAKHAEHDDVKTAVERLGHVLLHAGHALRGPRPVPSS